MKVLTILLLTCAVAFGQHFTGTYVLGNDLREVQMRSLDCPPFVIPLGAPQYPPELNGSGIVGRIGAVASVTKEGRVHWAIATHGNDLRFQEPVQRVIKNWRFSVPRQNGRAVAAYVNFTVVFSEGRAPEIIIHPITEPNQSPEPTPTAGTSAAEQPLVPAAVVAHL